MTFDLETMTKDGSVVSASQEEGGYLSNGAGAVLFHVPIYSIEAMRDRIRVLTEGGHNSDNEETVLDEMLKRRWRDRNHSLT